MEDSADTTIMGSDRRTFMHEEVGAFYIRYELNTGGVSESFILAGPALTVDEIAVGVDTEAIAGGNHHTSPLSNKVLFRNHSILVQHG